MRARALGIPGTRLRRALLFSIAVWLTHGCDDAECPAGTVEINAHCIVKDAGPASAESSSDAGHGMSSEPQTGIDPTSSGGAGTVGVGTSPPQSQNSAGYLGTGGSAGFRSPMGDAGAAPRQPSSPGGFAGTASPHGCGNGVMDPGETCDPADTCPTAATCMSTTACVIATLTGDASSCTAACEVVTITSCAPNDGCCPINCTFSTDNDCSQRCGDGEIDQAETCEPLNMKFPCPTSCDDGDSCTQDMAIGAAANCNVACVNIPITAPKSGDGCCPGHANANSDRDCSPTCGNHEVEQGEICDGSCMSSCDDGNPCTIDSQTGSAATCNIECAQTPSTTPECLCGNGRKDTNETCDNSSSARCVVTCNDNDPCTTDTMRGSAATCDFECISAKILGAQNNDGCCPSAANANNDNDCTARCGNGATEAGEKCDAMCPSTCSESSDLCAQQVVVGSGCQRECMEKRVPCGRYTRCNSSSDCDPTPDENGSSWSCSGFGVCVKGSVCNSTSECPSVPPFRAVCATGGYCLAGCSTTADCPPHTACSPTGYCTQA